MSIDILQEKIRKTKCPILVDFSVCRDTLPTRYADAAPAEGLAAFCRELMVGLKGAVPGLRFSFDQFALLGSAGLRVLSELLSEARDLGFYVVLDGPAIHTSWAAQRAAALLEENSEFYCDSLIVNAYIGSDSLRPFLERCKVGKSLFVLSRSANRSAAELQDLMAGSRLVHMAMADIVNRFGEPLIGKSGYSAIGAVTSATSANAVREFRNKYKRMFLVVDGLDYPGGNGKNASLGFDRFGHGCVLSVGPAVTAAWKEADGGEDRFVKCAQEAVDRIRNNMNRYISIL